MPPIASPTQRPAQLQMPPIASPTQHSAQSQHPSLQEQLPDRSSPQNFIQQVQQHPTMRISTMTTAMTEYTASETGAGSVLRVAIYMVCVCVYCVRVCVCVCV